MRVPPIAGPRRVEWTPINIQAQVAASNRTTTSSPSQPRNDSSNTALSLGVTKQQKESPPFTIPSPLVSCHSPVSPITLTLS